MGYICRNKVFRGSTRDWEESVNVDEPYKLLVFSNTVPQGAAIGEIKGTIKNVESYEAFSLGGPKATTNQPYEQDENVFNRLPMK